MNTIQKLKNISMSLFVTGQFLVANTLAAPQYYKITDLGDIPGGDDKSVASALNEKGQVVGWSDTASDVYFGDDGLHAFIWDAQNGLRDIGTSSQRYSTASSINESSVVVGYYTEALSSTWARGFMWTNEAGVIDLGVAGDYPYSGAAGINDNGYVVENNWSFYGPPSSVYLRSPSGYRTNIGIATGIENPSSSAINNANQIVGSESGESGGNAFRWDSVNGMTPIAPLPGGTSAYATGINSSGVVVGYSTITEGKYHPFIWDPVNGIRDLGVINSGESMGFAYGINDSNTVVGQGAAAPNIDHAFSWSPTAGLIDLNNQIVNLSGWQYIAYATAINNKGQIVGTGIRSNGATHAFILDPVATPVTCNGKIPTILGTSGNDKLTGTAGDDVIAGLEGSDRISGMGGNDVICGNSDKASVGTDTLLGGEGNDILIGAGSVTIFGDAGNDTLLGGSNRDALFGGAGDDILDAKSGDDVLNGGTGNDVVKGGTGSNDVCDKAPDDKTPATGCEIKDAP